jgi:hypothetical protein
VGRWQVGTGVDPGGDFMALMPIGVAGIIGVATAITGSIIADPHRDVRSQRDN